MRVLNPSTGALEAVLGGPRYGITLPSAMTSRGVGGLAVVGNDLFIGSEQITTGHSRSFITEVDIKGGSLVRVLSAPMDHLSSPDAMVMHGGNIYVAGPGADDVTEINASSGALVRVMDDKAYGFEQPSGIASWADHLYVPNQADDTLSDITVGP